MYGIANYVPLNYHVTQEIQKKPPIAASKMFPEAISHVMNVTPVHVMERPLEFGCYYFIHENTYSIDYAGRVSVIMDWVQLEIKPDHLAFLKELFGKCSRQVIPIFTTRNKAKRYLSYLSRREKKKPKDNPYQDWIVSKLTTKFLKLFFKARGYGNFIIDVKYGIDLVNENHVITPME
jgi:hypothetical protein